MLFNPESPFKSIHHVFTEVFTEVFTQVFTQVFTGGIHRGFHPGIHPGIHGGIHRGLLGDFGGWFGRSFANYSQWFSLCRAPEVERPTARPASASSWPSLGRAFSDPGGTAEESSHK